MLGLVTLTAGLMPVSDHLIRLASYASDCGVNTNAVRSRVRRVSIQELSSLVMIWFFVLGIMKLCGVLNLGAFEPLNVPKVSSAELRSRLSAYSTSTLEVHNEHCPGESTSRHSSGPEVLTLECFSIFTYVCRFIFSYLGTKFQC